MADTGRSDSAPTDSSSPSSLRRPIILSRFAGWPHCDPARREAHVRPAPKLWVVLLAMKLGCWWVVESKAS